MTTQKIANRYNRERAGFVFCSAAVIIVVMGSSINARAGEIITGTTATASSAFTVNHDGAAAVDATDLNASNLHISGNFGANISWLSGNNTTADEWIYVDLGAASNLEEVRVWNYHENSTPAADTSGRSVALHELWVASPGATLPAGLATTPFSVPNGWTQVTTGTLTKGPTTNPDPGNISPTDVFNMLGQNGVQYVGIDVGSRHFADPFTTTAVGLAQIQITAVVPEPSTLTLTAIAFLSLSFVGWRRRRR